MVPLKYVSNFGRTSEMPLINREINFILTWSASCFISSANANQAETFAITDTQLYVTIVTSSTQDNAKLLQQLKSAFKRRINWNKYQSKSTIQAQSQYLDYLIDPSFQGVNRVFVLSFADSTDRTGNRSYFLPNVKIKNYNVMNDRQNFLDQPVKSDMKTYDNIQKITTDHRDNYATSFLQDYSSL